MELERERMEHDRQRHERMIALHGFRHAGDREIGRLRVIAWIATASMIGTLLFFAQIVSALFAALRPGTRVTLGLGWISFLAALVLSLSGQARIAASLARIDDPTGPSRPGAGTQGALALWLTVAGLALTGLAAFTL